MKNDDQTVEAKDEMADNNISRRQVLRSIGTACAAGFWLRGSSFAGKGSNQPPQSGEALFRNVVAYSDVGDHRTGTEADQKTLKWLAGELSARGGTVSIQEFDFDRYDARAVVTIDGREVPSWPLYYQAVGQVTTDKPYHGDVEVADNRAATLEALLAGARQAKAPAAVFATTGAGGHLMVTNRNPKLGEGPPTVLVAGSMAGKLAKSRVTVDFDASIKPAKSANLIARFGDAGQKAPLVITTPLTGWFRCAGQHGTSVAIALEVAGALSKFGPVLFVGTAGNELNATGVRYYMRNSPVRPQGILHVGSNIASGKRERGSRMVLADKLAVTTSLGHENMARITKAVHGVTDKVKFNLDNEAKSPESWRGESRIWCRFDAPLLAISGTYGTYPLNGTPDDLPDQATSPALLAEVYQAVFEAGQLLFAPK